MFLDAFKRKQRPLLLKIKRMLKVNLIFREQQQHENGKEEEEEEEEEEGAERAELKHKQVIN